MYCPSPARARLIAPVALLAFAGSAVGAPPDITLTFDAPVPETVQDADGQGTGFAGIEGESEPGRIDLVPEQGVLRIGSTSGDFIDNTQDNGLFVEVDGAGGFAVTATLTGTPPLDDPNHSVGLWVGTDQDNYIKLVLIQVPDRDPDGRVVGSFPVIALGREEAGQTRGFELDPSSVRFDPILRAGEITLRLKVAADGGVTARYRDDRGAERRLVPPSLFTLAGITADVHAGITATSKNASTSPTFTFGDFEVDGDPGPTAVSLAPAPGADGVGLLAPVRLSWDEPIDTAGVAAGFSLVDAAGGAVPVTATASEDGRSFAFAPASALAPNAEYRASVASIRSADGRAAPDESWTFTTGSTLGTSPGIGGSRTGMCAAIAERVPPPAGGATITLTAKQLRINQRISAAAVRRANALQGWIDGGITADDICGGSIGRTKLIDDVLTATSVNPAPLALATPRVLEVPGAGQGGAGDIELTARQLRINQRIASAALRRARALEARMRNLTGGDLAPGGQIGVGKLTTGLVVTSPGASPRLPASLTRVKPPSAGGDEIERSIRQLKINQRIAAAAVRTLNRLVDQVNGGLTGNNFRNRSLTGADLD